MPECPVENCNKSTVACDPDWMMGHLSVDHCWDLEKASEYMRENWPDESEWDDCPEPPQPE